MRIKPYLQINKWFDLLSNTCWSKEQAKDHNNTFASSISHDYADKPCHVRILEQTNSKQLPKSWKMPLSSWSTKHHYETYKIEFIPKRRPLFTN